MELAELEEGRQCFAPQPLLYRWGGVEVPLPLRAIQPRRPIGAALPPTAAPAWQQTGEPGQPFDFTAHIRELCADIVCSCDELRHIDVSRLLFGVTQARNGRVFGLQARVTPLRFPRGRLTRKRHGVTYQVQRYFLGATEFLYLVTFCLPRFLDQDFDDKFITLFHELYHISPAFDGDLRRHHGRYCVHSHSQRQYDQRMAQLAREYLASDADPALYAFMRLNFNQIAQRHGSVIGIAVPRPKMIPLVLAAASRQK
jgi:predicted metallopeptidase